MSAPSSPSNVEALRDERERMQATTFTRWANNHLRRRGFATIPEDQVAGAFDDGIVLARLLNALFGVSIPKMTTPAPSDIVRIDNITLAFKMIDDANVKTNFLKTHHLIEHDKKMVLGMLWAFILEYAIKGISVDDMTAREGLLQWCRKQTKGYKVNQADLMDLQNFSSDWKSGLAFCALIHRHRPDLLSYDDALASNDAAANLELAFSVAEKHLDIPRLLDVDDIVAVPRPDERSVMTYVAEFFHRFASEEHRRLAIDRVAAFAKFSRTMSARCDEYERRARDLLAWVDSAAGKFSVTLRELEVDTVERTLALLSDLRHFVVSEKPGKVAEMMDLEAIMAEIQTELRVNGRAPFATDLSSDAIQAAFDRLNGAQRSYADMVRQHRLTFVKKAERDSAHADKLADFEATFAHFDADRNGLLSKPEFKAACNSLGVPFKTEAAFEALVDRITTDSGVPKDAFHKFLGDLYADRDTPEEVTESFAQLADNGAFLSTHQLTSCALPKEVHDYLVASIPRAVDNDDLLDYRAFVARTFKAL
ncbi:unnamed protein product (mitochondrion) [Plasmodiophora brassicae]|uniref:Calmodulin n=1 Tax=Plasmodiophora brassicae TaxID=37360 RepID=A0A0G4ILV3_PLABS|nr:hypothetical protein PBRA_004848 [Plasmodiophora brassicae]SPQ93297.1 unnamed protein product [Plasmodiophora brassicae]